jgi:hypothetical protein
MEGILLVFTIVITFGFLATGLMMLLDVSFQRPMRQQRDRRLDVREWPEVEEPSFPPAAARRRAASGYGGEKRRPSQAASPLRRSAARAARSQRPHMA